MALLLPTQSVAAETAPDFSGVWERGESARSTSTTAAALDKMFAPISLPGGEPVLKQPYADEYAARRAAQARAIEAGRSPADSHTLCLPEGMPHMMGMPMLMEIMQDRSKVLIVSEYLGQIRRIYIDGQMPASEDLQPSYSGYSVARWEGRELLIKTRGLRQDSMFFHIPHSGEMQIEERIRFIAPDRIRDDIVVSDVNTLAKPYRVSFEYRKSGYSSVSEYICEANRYRNEDGNDHLTLE